MLYMVTFTIHIPQMLAYIPAPWILWVWPSIANCLFVCRPPTKTRWRTCGKNALQRSWESRPLRAPQGAAVEFSTRLGHVKIGKKSGKKYRFFYYYLVLSRWFIWFSTFCGEDVWELASKSHGPDGGWRFAAHTTIAITVTSWYSLIIYSGGGLEHEFYFSIYWE